MEEWWGDDEEEVAGSYGRWLVVSVGGDKRKSTSMRF